MTTSENLVSFVLQKIEKIKRGKEPNKTALVHLGENHQARDLYSWLEYFQQACYFSHALQISGFLEKNKTDPSLPPLVVLAPLNLPESFFTLLGTILAGALPVPLSTLALKDKHGIKNFKFIIDHCQRTLVLANSQLRERLRREGISALSFNQLLAIGKCAQHRPPLSQTMALIESVAQNKTPASPLIMPFTSGTSGQPKGVLISHLNAMDRVQGIKEELAIGQDERLFSYLPLGHISALIADFFGHLLLGYTIFCSEYAAQTEKLRENFVPILKYVQPTVFLAVPKVWNNLREGVEKKINRFPLCLVPHRCLSGKVKRGLGLDQTKHFITAGSLPDDRFMEFFFGVGVKIRDIYGQTETTGPLLIDGKIIGREELTRVWLAPKDNEILSSGPQTMIGYYRHPQATAEVLETRHPSEDGGTIYHSGDVGQMVFTAKNGRRFVRQRIIDFGIVYQTSKGRGFKNAQGQFLSGPILTEQEQKIKNQLFFLEPRWKNCEVYIYGAHRPFNILLIFFPGNNEKQRQELQETAEAILSSTSEEGRYRLKKALVLDSSFLVINATMKISWAVTLDQPEIKREIEKVYAEN